jgi:plasmid stabilization system protein ParE
MAKRRIVWSSIAENELEKILEFYQTRNKSNIYSQKLYKKIKSAIILAAQKPNIGSKTKLKNIRGLIIDNYFVFYEIGVNELIILKIWDCRQNPENLIF